MLWLLDSRERKLASRMRPVRTLHKGRIHSEYNLYKTLQILPRRIRILVRRRSNPKDIYFGMVRKEEQIICLQLEWLRDRKEACLTGPASSPLQTCATQNLA